MFNAACRVALCGHDPVFLKATPPDEDYCLMFSALRERIDWRWPKTWRKWAAFVGIFGKWGWVANRVR
jgi:hypothetical protein